MIDATRTPALTRLLHAVDCSHHRGCATCRNQRIKGSKKTETVCSTCAVGWALRKDGSNKICGAHLFAAAAWQQPAAVARCLCMPAAHHQHQ
jgi:hypothetical protein